MTRTVKNTASAPAANKGEIARYSDELPAALQQQVRRILPVTEGNVFRTRAFKFDGDAGSTQWRTAQKTDSGLWVVREYKTRLVPYTNEDGDLDTDTPVTQKTILRNACFFDALYACADFEISEAPGLLGGVATGKTRSQLGLAHYRAFAEAQGIVFSKEDHLPIPVADGQILRDDCVLGMNDLKIAEKSRGNLADEKALALMQSENVTGTSGHNMAAAAAAGSATQQTGRALQKAEQIAALGTSLAGIEARYKRSERKLDQLASRFNQVRHYDGKGALTHLDGTGIMTVSSVGTGIAGVAAMLTLPLSGGALFLIAMASTVGGILGLSTLFAHAVHDISPLQLARDTLILPNRQFKAALRALRRDAARLPEGSEQRKAQEWIAGQAELAFCALSARYAFQKAAQGGGFFARRKLASTLRDVTAMATKMGMSESETALILEAIQQDPHSNSFEQEISSRLEQKIHEFNQTMHEYKKEELGQVKALAAPS